MIATLTIAAHSYEVDLGRPMPIAIDLNFNGDQPNFFEAPPATAQPLTSGTFVGATAQGGSCNVDQLQLTPHCNGTHTECARHVTGDSPPITEILDEAFIVCHLITIEPEALPGDTRVTADTLAKSFGHHTAIAGKGLIIRTNADDPLRRYSSPATTPYLCADIIKFCMTFGIKHLLTDLPSIDRMDDQQLTNHRVFFDTASGGNRNTITELVHVPNTVPDGLYLLNLQIAPFLADASPSRPILYRAWPLARK